MLECIKNGNQAAFSTFYLLWESRIYSYFLQKTNSYVDAQELTQNTFIKLWEYRSSLSTEHSLETQLFRKAKLVFIDWLRREATQRKRKEAELAYSDTSVKIILPITLPEKIENAINHLPPMRQKVIRLSHLQGYDYKEIANKLNISEKTVDNHIHKELKQLRRLLQCVIFLF